MRNKVNEIKKYKNLTRFSLPCHFAFVEIIFHL